MSKTKTVVLGVIICLFMIWFLPFAKYEILTMLHGHEFNGLYTNEWYGEISHGKVLNYWKYSARVYYDGGVFIFGGYPNNWKMVHWETIWSKTGNADDFIWPYFYHSAEGTVFFIFIVFLLCFIVGVYLFFMGILKRLKHIKTHNTK